MTKVPAIPTSLYAHTMNNGLQLVGQPMPDYETVALCYHVRTGSRDEHDADIFGVSHFLEHMVLKGTQMMDGKQLSLEWSKIGAEVNAFTSYESTTFHARVLNEHLGRAMELLSAMMYPRLAEEDFEHEKDVILNEIARAEDQPYNVVYRRMMQAYFGNHPLGHDVLGTPESIREMCLERMRDYWWHRYAANNLILAVAGNFDWDHLLELAQHHCEDWRIGDARRVSDHYELSHSINQIIVDSKLNQQIMVIALPSADVFDDDYYAVQLACNALGEEGSRLYWNIHQKGLAQSARTSLWTLEGSGLLLLEANSTPQAAPHVLRSLRTELNHWLDNGIDENELRHTKDKWISSMIFSSESPFTRMRSLTADWAIEGRLLSMDEEIERIEKVTLQSIHQALKRFPMREKQVLTALGPLTNNELLAECKNF